MVHCVLFSQNFHLSVHDLGLGIKALSFSRAKGHFLKHKKCLHLVFAVGSLAGETLPAKNIDNGAIIKAKWIWKSKYARLLSCSKFGRKHLQPDHHHWALSALWLNDLSASLKRSVFSPCSLPEWPPDHSLPHSPCCVVCLDLRIHPKFLDVIRDCFVKDFPHTIAQVGLLYVLSACENEMILADKIRGFFVVFAKVRPNSYRGGAARFLLLTSFNKGLAGDFLPNLPSLLPSVIVTSHPLSCCC